MALTGECPLRVRRPVMMHRWEQLTFLHWSFDPAVVQSLLPEGLTVEVFEGRAWVRVSAPPWIGRFCETNVRTYVVDGHGRTGVWFFSLEAARLAAVVAARVSYRLPYYWARMSLQDSGSRVVYTSRRRWPGAGPGSTVVVRPGAVASDGRFEPTPGDKHHRDDQAHASTLPLTSPSSSTS